MGSYKDRENASDLRYNADILAAEQKVLQTAI